MLYLTCGSLSQFFRDTKNARYIYHGAIRLAWRRLYFEHIPCWSLHLYTVLYSFPTHLQIRTAVTISHSLVVFLIHAKWQLFVQSRSGCYCLAGWVGLHKSSKLTRNRREIDRSLGYQKSARRSKFNKLNKRRPEQNRKHFVDWIHNL